MKNIKRVLLITAIVSAGILGAVLAVYFYHFRGQPLSDNPEDWAAFGSYIGGVIGAIFAMANLMFLVAIADFVEKQNDVRHRYGYRQGALERFEKIFKFVPYPSEDVDSESVQLCRKASLELGDFTVANAQLFALRKIDMARLRTSLFKYLAAMDEYVDEARGWEPDQITVEAKLTDMRNAYNEFSGIKKEFLSLLRKTME